MLKTHNSSAFRKDFKREHKTGKDMQKLLDVMRLLEDETPLDQKHHDHPLKGDWLGCRECHVSPDWLLIYKIEEDTLTFVRTGSHSELFG